MMPNIDYELQERLRVERPFYDSVLSRASFQFEEKVRELSVLRKIVESLKYTQNIRRVFEIIIDSILEETDAENCSIMLLNRQTGELSVKIAKSQIDSASNYYFDGTGSRRAFRMGEGVAGWVAQEGRPLNIPDIHTDERFVEDFDSSIAIRSILCLPFIVDEEVVGVVNLSHPECDAFGVEDERIMSVVIDQVAAALRNAQAFDDLQRFNELLEQQVWQRTLDLQRANEDLLKANEEILRLDRMKSQFFANMSHELRTPLNAIIGFSDLLQETASGKLDESQSRYITNILNSGRHLLGLINDILDLAKAQSGKMKVVLEPFSFRGCLEQVCDVIRPLHLEKNIAATVEIGEKIGLVIGDEVRIKQVLYNLLSNAVKFTNEGGRVDVCATTADGALRVSVSDTGIGIQKEHQEIIFSEFQQLNTPHSRRHQGTGLGLALTRKLVELHGGRIWVESEGEGKGSAFIFTLPQPADARQCL